MGLAQALTVGGSAGGRVHEWAGHGWLLGGAEGSMMLLSCFGFCNHSGSSACKPSKAAVCHLVIGGCKGPECVMHGALLGLNHMPITSDQASLAS